jgi:hypothetical protein
VQPIKKKKKGNRKKSKQESGTRNHGRYVYIYLFSGLPSSITHTSIRNNIINRLIVRPLLSGFLLGVIMSIDKSKTSFLTMGSYGGIDDEYYINEIIGIEELTYSDYIRPEHPNIDKINQQLIDLELGIKNVEVKL